MSTVRKVPMRKCVGCGEKREKKELVRIVRTPEEGVVLDLTGRKNGRGAYLCRDPKCLQRARKNRSLERSLETAIPEEVYDRLEKEMGTLA